MEGCIANHQGNTNQNHSETLPHSHESDDDSNNHENNKCWGGGGLGTFIHSWWGRKMVQLQWKAVWWLLRK